MIQCGTRGKVSFVKQGTTERLTGVIDSWSSANMVCVKLSTGEFLEVNKRDVSEA